MRVFPGYIVKKLFGDCKIPKPKTKEEEQLFDDFDTYTDLMKEFEDK